jgi:LysM repeat protein
MCGATLGEEKKQEATPVEPARPQPSRWLFWLATALVAIAVVTVASLLLRPLLFPAEPSVTPTAPATRTPTTAATSAPSPTLTPSPTPTPFPPRAHQVQEGETLLEIAEFYDTTVDEILFLNPGITPELLQVGQVLLIPPAVPTPGPTNTPTPEGPTPTPGNFIVHVVEPGETLLSIANEYGVTVPIIRAANPAIPAGSDVIRVNQTLLIPLGTPEPTPSPTVDLNATPTPVPLYMPPVLLHPPDQAIFGGPDASIVLQWASTAILRPNEWYELHLSRAGMESVVVRTLATAYRVPVDLYPPERSLGREFRWQVRVVRAIRGTEEYEPASLPGPVRVFRWEETLPTSTPSPTPEQQ